MDSAKYGGVVGQRKLSCAATGKGSMSKVSPGLWWWHEKICKIRCITLICSMVIVISNSHRGSTDSIPGGESNIFCLFVPKLACKNDGEEDHKVVCRWHQLTLGE